MILYVKPASDGVWIFIYDSLSPDNKSSASNPDSLCYCSHGCIRCLVWRWDARSANYSSWSSNSYAVK